MNSLVGTITYMAPEVRNLAFEGNIEGYYTEKADMWSLGCVLFSLLCGSNAFHGDLWLEVISENPIDGKSWYTRKGLGNQLANNHECDVLPHLIKEHSDFEQKHLLFGLKKVAPR